MKQTFTTLLTAILLISVYSCSKNSDSSTTNPTVNLGANQSSLAGTVLNLDTAKTSYKTSTSIEIVAATKDSGSAGSNVDIYLTANSALRAGVTYTYANTSSLRISPTINKKYYSVSPMDTTSYSVTINSLDSTLSGIISGSYKATVYANTDSF